MVFSWILSPCDIVAQGLHIISRPTTCMSRDVSKALAHDESLSQVMDKVKFPTYQSDSVNYTVWMRTYKLE